MLIVYNLEVAPSASRPIGTMLSARLPVVFQKTSHVSANTKTGSRPVVKVCRQRRYLMLKSPSTLSCSLQQVYSFNHRHHEIFNSPRSLRHPTRSRDRSKHRHCFRRRRRCCHRLEDLHWHTAWLEHCRDRRRGVHSCERPELHQILHFRLHHQCRDKLRARRNVV